MRWLLWTCRRQGRRRSGHGRCRPFAFGQVQVRLENRYRDGLRAEGRERGHRAPDLVQERRAGMDDRMASVRPIARWEQMDEPNWAMVHYPKIDYQDQYYYATPEEHGGKAEIAGRCRSEAAGNLREAGHSAEGTDDPCGCRRRRGHARRRPQGGGRCGVRLRFRRHDVSGGTEEGGRDLLLDLRGDPRASGAGEEIPRLGRAGNRTISLRR